MLRGKPRYKPRSHLCQVASLWGVSALCLAGSINAAWQRTLPWHCTPQPCNTRQACNQKVLQEHRDKHVQHPLSTHCLLPEQHTSDWGLFKIGFRIKLQYLMRYFLSPELRGNECSEPCTDTRKKNKLKFIPLRKFSYFIFEIAVFILLACLGFSLILFCAILHLFSKKTLTYLSCC